MKRKNLVVAGAVIGVLLMSAFIFSACGELEEGEELVLKPVIAPYISVPPVSASYSVGDTVKKLTAQVWDWDAEDGELTYQWYTFTSDTIADFIEKGFGTEVPEEEGGLGIIDPEEADETASGINVNTIELTLSFTPAAGKFYYYYLEITNTDPTTTDAADYKTIRSEIATLSFSALGAAKYPLISKQPASNAYQFGRNLVISELSVKAVSPDSGALSYQWYYNNGEDGGSTAPADLIEIADATDPIYRPTIDLLVPNKNYFFVEVTNDTGLETTSLLSVPAVVNMQPGQTALEPVIIEQPLDGIYFTGETAIAPLKVANEPSMDGGTISYQWYRNTTHSARGGSAISGATESEYTPPATAGTSYYYVAVINTNNFVVSSTKTATANSRAVRFVYGAAANPAANITVTVRDPRVSTNRFQYVRGYGGMDTAWANFPEQKPADMETMYNPDWGLGYNINRIMISPGNTNVNISIRDLVNSHRPNYYENVKIVNKYGGYNLASPWSPPKEWKTNNSINGGGKLIPAYRQQYADYLRAFAKHMFDAGAPIYAISISNEPNYTAGYDGCEWEPEDMRDFYKIAQPHPFTTGIRGFGGGKDYDRVLTVNGESANTPLINVSALRDPDARRNIDLLARHVYGEARVNLWRRDMSGNELDAEVGNNIDAVITANSILNRGDRTMYEVWMTEHNINSANATAYPNDSTWNYVWRFMNDIDLVMRMNNENAFVWWASKRFYSMIGDGQFGTRDGAALPRGIGLSHYAKYTNDTHRINLVAQGAFVGGSNFTNNNSTERSNSPLNNTVFNLDNITPRITAYASLKSGKDNQPVKIYDADDNFEDVEFISLVMWTPTTTRGESGQDLGTVRIDMPAGFLIGGVSAHKSISGANMFRSEDVQVSADRKAAFVTCGAGQILSVKLTRQQ